MERIVVAGLATVLPIRWLPSPINQSINQYTVVDTDLPVKRYVVVSQQLGCPLLLLLHEVVFLTGLVVKILSVSAPGTTQLLENAL